MATSRVLEVINGLVIAWRGAASLDGVTVAKAWEILPTGSTEHVFVAWDGDETNDEEEFATSTIEWPGPGSLSRREDGTVDCAVRVWSGDQSAVETVIARAYAIVGACEDVLRLDPALDSLIGLQAKITETRLRVLQSSEGVQVTVPFVVSFMSSV